MSGKAFVVEIEGHNVCVCVCEIVFDFWVKYEYGDVQCRCV